MEPATPTIARSMRARARVALVSIALSASFGIGGCAAIDDLKASISRWFDTANFPDEGVGLPGTAPESPLVAPEKIPKVSPRHQRRKSRRHVNSRIRRPLCFLPRNHRSPVPPGRQGRTKPRGNPRRPLLCDCALSILKRHRPEFFRAEIGPEHSSQTLPLKFKSPEARAVEGVGEDGRSAVGIAGQTTSQFKCCANTTGQGLRLRRNPFPRLRNTIETECMHRGPRIGSYEESPWAFPQTSCLGRGPLEDHPALEKGRCPAAFFFLQTAETAPMQPPIY